MTETEAPYYRPTFWDMKLPITPKLRLKVRDYHAFQGDKTGYAVKVVRASDGYPALLARAVNAVGKKISVIHGVDSDGDVSEICSCPRECEENMIEWFRTEPHDDYDREDE